MEYLQVNHCCRPMKNIIFIRYININTNVWVYEIIYITEFFFYCNHCIYFFLVNHFYIFKIIIIYSIIIVVNIRFYNYQDNHMFFGCKSLKELDLSKFNTVTVINMSLMFQGYLSLEKLNLSKFNTDNVVDMNNIFFIVPV